MRLQNTKTLISVKFDFYFIFTIDFREIVGTFDSIIVNQVSGERDDHDDPVFVLVLGMVDMFAGGWLDGLARF